MLSKALVMRLATERDFDTLTNICRLCFPEMLRWRAPKSHSRKWWLTGYGGNDPGWGYSLGMSWTDVINEYILAGVQYGLAGVIALCWVLYVSFSSLKTAYRKEKDPYMKSIYWAIGSLLIAVSIVWMSASFFGQLSTIFYCYLGIIGSVVLLPDRYKQEYNKQTVDKIYKTKLLNSTAGV